MISHLYVDNYRCFSNFEWKPGPLNLLLGDNGTGKTSVFDIVETLRDFVCVGTTAESAFPGFSRAAWDKRKEQTFELGVEGNGGHYLYRLVVEHDMFQPRNRIKLESLTYNDTPCYRYQDGEAHLFRDDGTQGPVFPFDWSRSAIATIPERQDNTNLTWFRQRLGHTYVLSILPKMISAKTEGEAQRPDRYMTNYVSWLRFLGNNLSFGYRLEKTLKPILDGFVGMEFKTTGETAKELRFKFDYHENAPSEEENDFMVPFDRVSDGQRCLTILYTALLVAQDSEMCLLCDEPDNYVSLREIQPWLTGIRELVEQQGRQCIIISHHPELINEVAAEHGMTFYRESGGPTRVKNFDWETGEVSPAEIVARGWET